jgi:hypothetical protein
MSRYLLIAILPLWLVVAVFAQNAEKGNPPNAAEPTPLLATDFDQPAEGSFAAALLRHRLIHPAPEAGPDGKAAIRVDYVGYDRGSKRVVVRHKLPAAGDEMTLCYNVKFDEDFPFVRGGKLHGLGPARPITGGRPMRPDGWSARVMFKKDAGLATYLYTQGKDTKWGIGQRADNFRFQPGRWHAVSIHVRLNTAPDKADGFTHVYVDGKRVIQHDNVHFRAATGAKTAIQQVLFSTFHGGSSPAWAPKDADGNYITTHAWFHSLAVHRGRHIRPALEPR